MTLKDKQDKFIYLTGLTTHGFDCLYEYVEPFLHLIRNPDCKGGGLETKIRKLNSWLFLQFVDTCCTWVLWLEYGANK